MPLFSLDSHLYTYDRLDIMRKVWIYKRKGIKGWWIGWYESGKRKTKALPSKALAEHFRQIKYTQYTPTHCPDKKQGFLR
jgi:hypothetical protein